MARVTTFRPYLRLVPRRFSRKTLRYKLPNVSISILWVDHHLIISDSTHDVEQLITRTESAVDVVQEEVKKGGLSFEFAKIWLPEKGAVEELPEEPTTAEQDHDFWARALAQATAEQEAAKERARQQMGRGARRRKEVVCKSRLFWTSRH